MFRESKFEIPNYKDLNLEKRIELLKSKYDKDISKIALLETSIPISTYFKKVNEIEVIIQDFNNDLSFYLEDYKSGVTKIDENIAFLIGFLYESVRKQMSSLKNSKYDSMIPFIEN